MRLTSYHFVFTLLIGAGCLTASAQIGIGTTTPDGHAVLDITSTTQGVLFPRLTTAQQNVLAGLLTSSEMGMIVIDATTGLQMAWTGSAWNTVAASSNAPTAAAPLKVTTNKIKINAGTNAGDLISWNGTIWVNMQPAVQHFTFTEDNHQPYLVNNYMIALYGIFPSRSDANQPFVGEIYQCGCNFAISGFALCDGSLLSISQNQVLFALIGTTYGGNGQTNYALPDLRGRIPIHQGSNGVSTYTIGENGGTESKVILH
jgi:microcystin-dependent protein